MISAQPAVLSMILFGFVLGVITIVAWVRFGLAGLFTMLSSPIYIRALSSAGTSATSTR